MSEFAPQLKLLGFPKQLRSFMADDLTEPPVSVEISPTNHCNAKCPWCFFVGGTYKQRHSREELDFEVLKKALGEIYTSGVESISWTGGGDPSVYTHIDEAILFASCNLGLKQGIFTNGYKTLKYPHLLDWIRITVTEKYIITKPVAEYAKVTKVGVNFNLCEENEKHLYPMALAARDAGVAYFQVRPALADNVSLQKEITCPTNLKSLETPTFRIVLTDYKWQDYLKPHGYPICYGHSFVPFLWHNGDLSVCAYHFGKEPYKLGNIVTDGGFHRVWNGERRRAMLTAGVSVIPECQHCCKLHEINKPLAMLKDDIKPEVDDPSFL